MPAIADITLNGVSGADHVFTPLSTTNNVVTWVKAGTAPVGDEKLSFSTSILPSGKRRSILKLVVPKTQDVDVGGVVRPTVVKTAIAALEITTDSTHTLAERGELMDLLRSALNETDAPVITAAIENNQPFY